MAILDTPFGNIEIRIDGQSVHYIAKEMTALQDLCPNVLGRYRIDVALVPDGKRHKISCTFPAGCPYNRSSESGENLECQSFYNSHGYKMSVGVEGESGHMPDGSRISNQYDYDVDYLENGMAYLVLESTKTEHYVFGIAWIDHVSWVNASETDSLRDTETWFGADPTLIL